MVEEFCKEYELTIDQFYGREVIGSSLDLDTLTNIPEGFNPIVIGYLSINKIVQLPNNFSAKCSGDMFLGNLRSIGDNCTLIAGRSLKLNSLSDIPDSLNAIGGYYITLSKSITRIYNYSQSHNVHNFNMHSDGYLVDNFNNIVTLTYIINYELNKIIYIHVKDGAMICEIISENDKYYHLRDMITGVEFYLCYYKFDNKTVAFPNKYLTESMIELKNFKNSL